MVSKPASVVAQTVSSPAAELLDQLLAAIQKPTADDLPGAVAGVETAFRRRSVNVEIRSPDDVQRELDLARRTAIKADLNGDGGAHKIAADRVSALEKELADLPMKRSALAELQDERRDAVDAANVDLGSRLSSYRQDVGEAAKALEAEALRLWSVAATARKAVETTQSRFDKFGLFPKTSEMEDTIRVAQSLFPAPWSSAMQLWWRVHEWVCRP